MTTSAAAATALPPPPPRRGRPLVHHSGDSSIPMASRFIIRAGVARSEWARSFMLGYSAGRAVFAEGGRSRIGRAALSVTPRSPGPSPPPASRIPEMGPRGRAFPRPPNSRVLLPAHLKRFKVVINRARSSSLHRRRAADGLSIALVAGTSGHVHQKCAPSSAGDEIPLRQGTDGAVEHPAGERDHPELGLRQRHARSSTSRPARGYRQPQRHAAIHRRGAVRSTADPPATRG
jgi:hypothetical protein